MRFDHHGHLEVTDAEPARARRATDPDVRGTGC